MEFLFGFLFGFFTVIDKQYTEEKRIKMVKKAIRRRKIKEANIPLIILVILVIASLFYCLKG